MGIPPGPVVAGGEAQIGDRPGCDEVPLALDANHPRLEQADASADRPERSPLGKCWGAVDRAQGPVHEPAEREQAGVREATLVDHAT